MPDCRSDKSPYPSRYSPGGWVSAPQYITELICERAASIKKKDLPIQFWNLPIWRTTFRNQITAANKLLKEYHEIAIIKAIKRKEAKNIYSLRAPHLIRLILEEQAIQSLKIYNESVAKKIIVGPVNETPIKPFSIKKNQINKLRNLDG